MNAKYQEARNITSSHQEAIAWVGGKVGDTVTWTANDYAPNLEFDMTAENMNVPMTINDDKRGGSFGPLYSKDSVYNDSVWVDTSHIVVGLDGYSETRTVTIERGRYTALQITNMILYGNPSFLLFSATTINTAIALGTTSNQYAIANWNSTTNTRKDLFLPSNSGTYILKATDTGAFGKEYTFNELNAVGLFHEALGVESTNLCLIAYKGNSAFGVNVPAMNISSGYFVFRNEENTELPTTSILDSTVIYQNILGCTSTERCLVYNDGSSVSKLTVPTTAGSYVLNVSSNGLSFTTPPAKLSKTFTYTWPDSGHSVVSEYLGSDNSNVTEEIMLSSNCKYLVTIDLSLKCTDYEQAFVGFTSTPTLIITTVQSTLLKTTLDSPMPSMNVSGTSIFSPLKDGGLALVVTRSGDTTISHTYSHFQVTIVEL